MTDVQNGSKMADSRRKASGDLTKSETSPLLVLSVRSEVQHSLNSDQAVIHLVKGLLGTGLLALPMGFKNAGLWTGLGLLLVINFINAYCMRQVVNAAHFHAERKGVRALDYANVMRSAVENGPQWMRRYGYAGKLFVNSQIMINNLGFCCVYFVFMADNLQQVAEEQFSVQLSSRLLIAALVLPVLLLCSIRHLRQLAPLALLANALYIVALLVTFAGVLRELPPSSRLPAVASPSTLPLFFGTVMFAFEGVCLVMPIENRMERAGDFIRWNGVLNTGCALVTAVYAAVGFFGYVKYGADIEDSITLNLPHFWPFETAKLMFVLAVLVTYAIQFYVVMERVEKFIERKLARDKPSKQLLLSYAARALLVLLTLALAELIPHLSLFISLVGSLAGASLCLIVPPLIDSLAAFARHGAVSPPRLATNALICLLGLLGFATGTYSSLSAIVRVFSSDQ